MDTGTARRICVTGASGQAGRAVVRELVEHGYEVSATDIATTRADLEAGALRADLTDYGQALEALKGARCRDSPGQHPGARHLARRRSRSTPT